MKLESSEGNALSPISLDISNKIPNTNETLLILNFKQIVYTYKDLFKHFARRKFMTNKGCRYCMVLHNAFNISQFVNTRPNMQYFIYVNDFAAYLYWSTGKILVHLRARIMDWKGKYQNKNPSADLFNSKLSVILHIPFSRNSITAVGEI